MTNLCVLVVFCSIVVSVLLGLCISKIFSKTCFLTNKRLWLCIVLTFLGLNILYILPSSIAEKIWIIANLAGIWILYYYHEIIKNELYFNFRNNFKFLRSEKRKNLIVFGTIVYIIISVIVNYYVTNRTSKAIASIDFSLILDISVVFLLEIVNIFYLLILLGFYYLPKVIIWGENLTKYEGWIVEETPMCFILKEKFSGKIITIKKEAINQIVVTERGF